MTKGSSGLGGSSSSAVGAVVVDLGLQLVQSEHIGDVGGGGLGPGDDDHEFRIRLGV